MVSEWQRIDEYEQYNMLSEWEQLWTKWQQGVFEMFTSSLDNLTKLTFVNKYVMAIFDVFLLVFSFCVHLTSYGMYLFVWDQSAEMSKNPFRNRF